jgi:hypothetical protein
MMRKKYKFLKQCPLCEKRYSDHWKVVNHIRKTKSDNHISFIKQQEKQLVEFYIDSKKDIHKRLYQNGNIFSGISYEKIMLSVAKYLSVEELESIRRKRISKTMKKIVKSDAHNMKVSASVKKAWKNGKFDTEEYKKKVREGYKKRRSYKGKNNPMYGKPAPKGSGFGKGGLRKDIGHYVRSSWEANVCRICKYVDRYYQYEPKRFDIIVDGEECTYCPDLFFSSKNFYYEIKGHAKSSKEWICQCKDCKKNRKKIEQVKAKYGVMIKIIGNKEYKRFKNRFSNVIDKWEK